MIAAPTPEFSLVDENYTPPGSIALVPPGREKEAGNDSSKGLFLERISQVAITTASTVGMSM
jgi:hypothetical protein